jgi:hypothetical protein
LIVCLDVVRDGIDQLLHAMKDATTNSFLSDFPKPALDQVEPGRKGVKSTLDSTRLVLAVKSSLLTAVSIMV